ncbi:hypothetical protein [Sphingobacterium chuzhouense]|uniref:Alpha-L-rhamnosidase six-hairpin glycosidase domain-containing protein n=1 Tax=Sphingobacterium chuzhouense TaxID=1742264 RepID=A0ABR7XNZ0_9SPHI|nr:hypothetical protein [Sphingobacterium chuzhouense]MBD1420885.1 hypothetical protein [Sphingobacterium chuzhouense]
MANKNLLPNSRRNFLRNAIGTITASALVPGYTFASVKEIRSTEEKFNCDISDAEPNATLAKLWWPEQRNVWTPIGWKNHYFRFNVLYNGDVITDPNGSWLSPRKNARPFVGKDFLLSVRPSKTGMPAPIPKERISVWKLDGGVGIQGWNEQHETPILYTDYPLQEGVIIRQEIFSHVKGGGEAENSTDPLFAWIRISITYVDEHRYPDSFPICIQLSKNYYDHHDHFEHAVAVDINPAGVAYPQALTSSAYKNKDKSGIQVTEPDGKVRLMVVSPSSHQFMFSDVQRGVYMVKTDLRADVGDYIDVLLPMLTVSPEEADRELSFGYDAALAESDRFWSYRPKTAATVHVPEKHINNVIKQSLKFAEIIAEKDYKTQEYTTLSGSWGYDNLWTTPTSMVSHMFLDLLGYHDAVARYLELFRKNQGTVKPPGPAYDLHLGYYSTPKNLTAIDWLTDHGAVLHQVCTHALLTADQTFIDQWIESVIKACAFIKDMCAKTGHGGVEGLLPPAVATDEEIPMQALWNLVWNYKGLTTAVRLLEKITHTRAKEFSDFAAGFKVLFLKTYTKLAKEGQYWTDIDGKKRYKPPTVMSNEPQPHHIFSDAFYLDTGPMALVWAGLMDADDPIMRDTVEFFRNGPNERFTGMIPHALWRPYLVHEMSTCEPCYSWNIIHSWQLNDRHHFLEGMYSLYMGALSQNTYISCEHRHGIQGNLFATPLAFYLSRLAVIDDQLDPDILHIMRMCPLAWISSEKETVFDSMPTEYGPVNLRFILSTDGKTLDIKFKGNWREKPDKIRLHAPPLPGLTSIVVNGKKYKAKKNIIL